MTIIPPSDPQEEIANLRDEVAELQRQLAAADTSAEVSELRRQLDAAQAELAALRTPPPTPDEPAPTPRGKRLDGFYEVEN